MEEIICNHTSKDFMPECIKNSYNLTAAKKLNCLIKNEQRIWKDICEVAHEKLSLVVKGM
jgi:hypothetical protein